MITYEKSAVYRDWVALESGEPRETFEDLPIATLMCLYPRVHMVGPNTEGYTTAFAGIMGMEECLTRGKPADLLAIQDFIKFVMAQEDYIFELAWKYPLRYTAMTTDIPFLSSSFSFEKIRVLIPGVTSASLNASQRFRAILNKIMVLVMATDIVPKHITDETKNRLALLRKEPEGIGK